MTQDTASRPSSTTRSPTRSSSGPPARCQRGLLRVMARSQNRVRFLQHELNLAGPAVAFMKRWSVGLVSFAEWKRVQFVRCQDCCSARGDFECDDAWDRSRSALRGSPLGLWVTFSAQGVDQKGTALLPGKLMLASCCEELLQSALAIN